MFILLFKNDICLTMHMRVPHIFNDVLLFILRFQRQWCVCLYQNCNVFPRMRSFVNEIEREFAVEVFLTTSMLSSNSYEWMVKCFHCGQSFKTYYQLKQHKEGKDDHVRRKKSKKITVSKQMKNCIDAYTQPLVCSSLVHFVVGSVTTTFSRVWRIWRK